MFVTDAFYDRYVLSAAPCQNRVTWGLNAWVVPCMTYIYILYHQSAHLFSRTMLSTLKPTLSVLFTPG